jgi:protoheme IX farnesyltransferase
MSMPSQASVFQAAPADACVPTTSMFADISRLTRPRIALMVLATVVTAAWLTAGRPADVGGLLWLLAGTALVAASSSIANQILERDTDRLMPRTARRPLVTGRMSVSAAVVAATVLLLAGVGIMTAAAGWPAAAAAVATWLVYVVVYTPMKRCSPLNTAVGAVAGGLPVAIGWLAADGPQRLAAGDAAGALAVAALGTVLYLWQFPHFMAIAWLYRGQYAQAGLRMLTVDDPSGLRAAGQSLAAALAMLPVSLVLAVPSASVRLFLAAMVASLAYCLATVRFAVRRDDASARLLLLTSLGSLLAILTAAVVFGRPA